MNVLWEYCEFLKKEKKEAFNEMKKTQITQQFLCAQAHHILYM